MPAAPGNAAFGLLADGGFVAKLGAGLRLAAADLKSDDGVDLSALPQPLPGVRLTKAKWEKKRKRLEGGRQPRRAASRRRRTSRSM